MVTILRKRIRRLRFVSRELDSFLATLEEDGKNVSESLDAEISRHVSRAVKRLEADVLLVMDELIPDEVREEIHRRIAENLRTGKWNSARPAPSPDVVVE